jgi:hypothetical protein
VQTGVKKSTGHFEGMPNDSKGGDKYRPTYVHSDQKSSRSDKWRIFTTNLKSWLGTKTPLLAEHVLSDVFDEEVENCGQPEDFFTYVLGLDDDSDDKDIKKAQKEYKQAQYELFLCLTTNFAESDQATIDKYQQQAVVARIMKQTPDLPKDHMSVRFVPFASLCYKELGSKYDDKGATDALIKLHNFQIAKQFKSNNVSSWISVVENTWSQVAAIADDPAYLAALELLLNIKNSKHEIWSGWASVFAHEHRDKTFNVTELLSQVRVKNNLETASSTAQPPASVHYTSAPGGVNISSKKGRKGNKKQRKVCLWDGCNKPTRFKYCTTHYRKTKSSEHSGVSDATSAKIKTSSLESAKKAMLKAQERYKEIKASQSAGSEANVAEANTVALETADEYEHDNSDVPAHSIISRKRKRTSSTSAAKPKTKAVGKNKVLADVLAKKKKKKIKRSTAEALVACQDDFFAGMTVTQFDRS